MAKDTGSKKGLFKTLAERSKAETPPFFKKLRTAGLIMAAAGSVVVTSPFALPAAVVTVCGYLIVAGSVATAVSQVTVNKEETESEK